jgi:hypothetical protein
VWELWDKETRRVFWWVRGFAVTLDDRKDPLGLTDYWPCPRPMLKNATTSLMMPRPDFKLAQGLYEKMDRLAARISLLEQAIAVRGVYDGKSPAIQDLLKRTTANELVPVDNWAVFADAGGLKGVVEWLPLDMIVQALGALREEAAATKMDLFEVTGWTDILRGQSTRDGVTATEARAETRSASVQMQARQDEFARFASDIQRLRAEVICSKFDPERIIERSNVLNTPDKQLAQQAVAFLKDKLQRVYRIEVRPESMSMADFAAQKAERVEVMEMVTGTLTAAAPLVQAAGPGVMTVVLRLLQWAMAGVRGSRGAEGILDPAIAEAEQAAEQAKANPQQAPPDPKVMAAQAKAQADAAKAKADIERLKAKAQLDVATETQKQEIQTTANLQEEQGRLEMKDRYAAKADARKAALTPPKEGPKS